MCFDPGNHADGQGNTIFAQTQMISRNRYRQQSVKLMQESTHYNRVLTNLKGWNMNKVKNDRTEWNPTGIRDHCVREKNLGINCTG